MPDEKKVSQMTETTGPLTNLDLFPVVANSGSPRSRKILVENLLQWNVTFPSATRSILKFTANVASNAVSATLSVGEFILLSNTSAPYTTRDRISLISRNLVQNNNSNTTGMMAAGLFQLDLANSNANTANTFGVIVDLTLNTAVASARSISPQAFFGLKDRPGTGGAATKYLMDVGMHGNTVSQDIANNNTTVLFSKTGDLTATHTIKLRINGQDFWLLGSNTGPA